jgi:uncharacterized membrane protein YciS (DUF1049 family)
MGKIIRWVVVASVAVLGVGLAVLNTGSVDLNYYYGTMPVSVAWLIGGSVAIGMAFGLVVNLFIVLNLRRQVSAARRQVHKAAQSAESGRLVPIKTI